MSVMPLPKRAKIEIPLPTLFFLSFYLPTWFPFVHHYLCQISKLFGVTKLMSNGHSLSTWSHGHCMGSWALHLVDNR